MNRTKKWAYIVHWQNSSDVRLVVRKQLLRGCSPAQRPGEQQPPSSNPNQLVANFLAHFEEWNSLRRYFNARSGLWIARNTRTPLARLEDAEPANLNLVPGSKGTDDHVKYGADDIVGFLQGNASGLVNLFGQVGPGHLPSLFRIGTRVPQRYGVAPDAGSFGMIGRSEKVMPRKSPHVNNATLPVPPRG